MSRINSGLFDTDQVSEIDDIMSEEEADSVEQGMVQQYEAPEEAYGEYIEEQAVELSEDEELEGDMDLVLNARLRLDQGRLYEMIMNHNFFDGVDADPKAIRNVQRELRNHAKERLEVLLGLKKDPKLAPVQPVKQAVQQIGQFSDLETDILKRFISKMSGGVTEKVTEVPKKVITNTIAPMKTAPKVQGGLSGMKPKPVAQPVQPAKAQAKLLPQRPQTSGKQAITGGKQAIKEDKPLDKPVSEMNAQELMDRNKRAADRQAASKQVVSKRAAPMPTVEEQTMLYSNRQARNAQMGTIQTLVNLVQQNKRNKGEDYE